MTTKPKTRPIAVQIKGDPTDPLLCRLKKFAEKRGLQIATAARMLLKAALDTEERKP
jgi:hypothetical protein